MTARKAIHFSHEEECRVHEIPTLDELTDEEYASSYYSAAEYLWMNKRERKLLKRLKMVGDVGPEEDMLGLVTRSQNQERHVFMDCAHNAVFAEQQRQIEEEGRLDLDHLDQGRGQDQCQGQVYFDLDQEAIAKLYSQATEEPCHRSHLRAVSLHRELSSCSARHGSRRWSMDMDVGRGGGRPFVPRRPPPPPSLADNFDFSETVPSDGPAPGPPQSLTSPRWSCKKVVAPLPIHVMQSPNQNRWSQDGSSTDKGLTAMNSAASLGLPRRLRTPQCQGRKTLGFSQHSNRLATPAL
ncbi:MAG: hypothetical protein SGBAC_006177 [Bacillariaceae sp.]